FNDGPGKLGRYSVNAHKPIVSKVADTSRSRDPDATDTILEDGLDTANWPSWIGNFVYSAGAPLEWCRSLTRFAIRGRSALMQSVQAVRRAKPDTAIVRCQERHRNRVRQPLLDRNRSGRRFAEAVEPLCCRHPDIA